ncbi:DUF3857 domain-containing protein [Planktosalinus lacus]|uniref:DUF3857 domain-containing protein n=1 Tax=Planktosalinus lacus TaxID=1526573 RepID=A0A8J2Y8Z7_9FLAO|nr:DUF3857 domain-containing protein [Planktosalinus lacus]GGD89477.1 hypothetical protein GCM10011312_11710 [Planktosalinus lacus]
MRLLLLIFLTFSASAQKELTQSLLIPVHLTESADAIVRSNELEVNILSTKEVKVNRKVIVTVLNKAGNKHVWNFIYYDNSIKVKKAEAFIYDALGKEIKKFKKRDFKDRSAVDGGTLYSDSRYLYADYTPLSYPYTFEISYETTSENTLSLPFKLFIHSYNVSSQNSSLKVHYNSTELDLNYKEKNFGDYQIEKTVFPGILSYTAKDIPALVREDYSPPFLEMVPQVHLAPTVFYYEGIYGEARNWKELGKWFYDNLIVGRDKVSSQTLSEVQALVAGVDDKLERARLVYEYVQQNTRYISVQVGIGGVQPIEAQEVDKVKYGDCKGLTNYTKSLLDAVGVPSYYAHVEAGNIQENFEEDFASIAQGNHVILAIPNDSEYTWIDCTSQVHPFGFIGDFTDNRNVLIMKPEGGEIVKTTAYTNQNNFRKTNAVYSIDETGTMKATVEITNQGIPYDNRFKLDKFSKEELHKFYVKNWRNINNLSLSKTHFENDKENVSFEETVELEARNYAAVNGSRLFLSVNAFNNSNYVPSRYRDRKSPVKFFRGFLFEDNYLISLPDSYQIEAFPESVSIDTKFGTYTLELVANEDHTITLTRKLFLKEGDYPKEDYKAFRDFFKDISNYDNSKIVLNKKES